MKKIVTLLFVTMFAVVSAFASFSIQFNDDDSFCVTVGNETLVVSGEIEDTLGDVTVKSTGGTDAYYVFDKNMAVLVNPYQDNKAFDYGYGLFRVLGNQKYHFVMGKKTNVSTGIAIRDGIGSLRYYYDGIILPNTNFSEYLAAIKMDTRKLHKIISGSVVTFDNGSVSVENPVPPAPVVEEIPAETLAAEATGTV